MNYGGVVSGGGAEQLGSNGLMPIQVEHLAADR